VHRFAPTLSLRYGMWSSLLFALDQFESGQRALEFASDLAAANGCSVRVLHIREFSHMGRLPPIETQADAAELVADAVFRLRMRGVGAGGRSRASLRDRVAERIVEEAMFHECDAIVLGSRRLHGYARLSAQGVRERVLRFSELPLLIAPTGTVKGPVNPFFLGEPAARSERRRT
jgi:nucleotide-binding universal stress UspA family protein